MSRAEFNILFSDTRVNGVARSLWTGSFFTALVTTLATSGFGKNDIPETVSIFFGLFAMGYEFSTVMCCNQEDSVAWMNKYAGAAGGITVSLGLLVCSVLATFFLEDKRCLWFLFPALVAAVVGLAAAKQVKQESVEPGKEVFRYSFLSIGSALAGTYGALEWSKGVATLYLTEFLVPTLIPAFLLLLAVARYGVACCRSGQGKVASENEPLISAEAGTDISFNPPVGIVPGGQSGSSQPPSGRTALGTSVLGASPHRAALAGVVVDNRDGHPLASAPDEEARGSGAKPHGENAAKVLHF